MIAGIGTVVVDHVLQMNRYPISDTKNVIRDHLKQVGGPVPVALSTAAFFGTTTAFLGRWGDDDAGRFVEETLRQRNVDYSFSSSRKSWSTGFAHVWTEAASATRTIAYSRGEFPVPGSVDVSQAMLDRCTILHLDGWAPEAAVMAAQHVRDQGGTVVLDGGSVKPGMEELLPLVDILVASRLFRTSRFGTSDVTDRDLLSLGPPTVISTDGAQGASWLTADTRLHEPAASLDAVDTNGAGDVFCGALLHSMATGAQPRETLQFACCVAGQSCTRHGNFRWTESFPA